MKTYRCHKIVQASKIIGVTTSGKAVTELELEDGTRITDNLAALTVRHHPIVGDYLVMYEDGYMSLSPSKAFEDGYTELKTGLMTFSQALEQVKLGARAARVGWNGKGMFIALQAGSVIPSTAARGGVALELAKAGVADITILPHIDMKAADGSVVVGWLASQTDMLAEDWAVVL